MDLAGPRSSSRVAEHELQRRRDLDMSNPTTMELATVRASRTATFTVHAAFLQEIKETNEELRSTLTIVCHNASDRG